MDLITKTAHTFRMTYEQLFESLAHTDKRYHRKSVTTETPPTREQWHRYNEAKKALKVLEAYEGTQWGGPDYGTSIRRPKPTVEFDYLETHDEWLARCHALYVRINGH